jgi:hypothetical protein
MHCEPQITQITQIQKFAFQSVKSVESVVPSALPPLPGALNRSFGISGMITAMPISTVRVSQMILDQLANGEKRVLSLVVSIRKAMDPSEVGKGDLSAMVKSALRSLVASRAVVDVDGMYSLSPRH